MHCTFGLIITLSYIVVVVQPHLFIFILHFNYLLPFHQLINPLQFPREHYSPFGNPWFRFFTFYYYYYYLFDKTNIINYIINISCNNFFSDFVWRIISTKLFALDSGIGTNWNGASIVLGTIVIRLDLK